MKILFWPDGCWVYYEERHQMTHRSDDYAEMELDDDTDEHVIDVLVFSEVSK